ncbi:MAG TPA: tetratricopeptide repeat protein, partial [Mucilaginibacter sp.]|nr:tetratricopeptide repeat protein [Mucilaginibacter sp.]
MRYLIVFLCFWSFWGYAQSSQGVNSTQLKSATDKEKLKLYLKFSQAYTSNQPDSAVYYANQGMLLAERMKNWSAQAVFLLQLGRINAVHHHDELARRFYNESLNISRRAHDAAGTANAYDELGLLDVKDQNGVSGDKDLNLAMKFYNNSRDTADMIESLQQLGKVYEEKGDIEKALSYNLKALAKYEQLRQKPETYFVLLEQIGNLYLKKGQPKMALTYLQEGVKRSSAQGMKDTEVSLIDEEGEAYQFEGQQGKALSTYKQALQDAQKFKQPEEEAKALIGIASV